jgi:Xaa-Pro aminopeptidase
MAGRFAARWRRLRGALSREGVDALFVTHPPNVFWLTGFSGSYGMVLVTPDSGLLMTDARYIAGLGRGRAEFAPRLASPRWREETAALLRESGVKRLHFEPEGMTFGAVQRLGKALGKIALLPVPGIIEPLRARKDPGELRAIEKALAVTIWAFTEVAGGIRHGRTEREIAAEIAGALRRHGADKEAFDTIVASGPRSAIPHASPTDRPLMKGEWVVIDMGAACGGYNGDLTRSVHLGPMAAGDARLFSAVLAAQEAAIAAIRPGVPAREVDAAARGVLDKAGLERYFTHSTGHGLGLQVHEAPRLSKEGKELLEEGMVVTVEPGVYRRGIGGVRIEDVVLVTAKGCRVLTENLEKRWVIR